MGTLATDALSMPEQYGKLAVRFNTLRGWVKCVRVQLNEHKSADGCL